MNISFKEIENGKIDILVTEILGDQELVVTFRVEESMEVGLFETYLKRAKQTIWTKSYDIASKNNPIK